MVLGSRGRKRTPNGKRLKVTLELLYLLLLAALQSKKIKAENGDEAPSSTSTSAAASALSGDKPNSVLILDNLPADCSAKTLELLFKQ
jgi:hypothetical protein